MASAWAIFRKLRVCSGLARAVYQGINRATSRLGLDRQATDCLLVIASVVSLTLLYIWRSWS